MDDLRAYTYGSEIELADIDCRRPLPAGFSWSETEHDIVNSRPDIYGLANCPTRNIHPWGGEICMPVTSSVNDQVKNFMTIMKLFPEATLNFRLDLHCHISYPGLTESLEDMKKILKYTYEQSGEAIKIMYDMHKDPGMESGDWAFYKVNMAVIPEWKYKKAMDAKTPAEFKFAHQCDTHGKYNPRLTKRYGVNLFSIFKHGTVEFRHFFPTLYPKEFYTAVEYTRRFMNEALSDSPRDIVVIIGEMQKEGLNFSTELPFIKALQEGWKFTNYPKNKKNQLVAYEEFCRDHMRKLMIGI